MEMASEWVQVGQAVLVFTEEGSRRAVRCKEQRELNDHRLCLAVCSSLSGGSAFRFDTTFEDLDCARERAAVGVALVEKQSGAVQSGFLFDGYDLVSESGVLALNYGSIGLNPTVLRWETEVRVVDEAGCFRVWFRHRGQGLGLAFAIPAAEGMELRPAAGFRRRGCTVAVEISDASQGVDFERSAGRQLGGSAFDLLSTAFDGQWLDGGDPNARLHCGTYLSLKGFDRGEGRREGVVAGRMGLSDVVQVKVVLEGEAVVSTAVEWGSPRTLALQEKLMRLDTLKLMRLSAEAENFLIVSKDMRGFRRVADFKPLRSNQN